MGNITGDEAALSALQRWSMKIYHHSVKAAPYVAPLCPAGHLPHMGGDRPAARLSPIASVERLDEALELPISAPCGGDVRQDRGGQRRARTSGGVQLMRPSLLDPLFRADHCRSKASARRSPDMIAKVVPADATDRDVRVGDLLFVLPHSIIDRRNRPGIALAAEGAIVTLEVRVDRHQPPPRGNRNVPYRVFAHDDTGEIALTFFHAKRPLARKGDAGRRAHHRQRPHGMVQRPPDRWCIPTISRWRAPPRAAADRAGLSADRRAVGARCCAARSARRWRACRTCRNGRTTTVIALADLSVLRRGAGAAAQPGRPDRCRRRGRCLAAAGL